MANQKDDMMRQNADNDADIYTVNFEAYRPGITQQQSTAVYNEWTSYEQDLNLQKYRGPIIAAEAVAEFFPGKRDRKLILDVAAGTGFVGEELWRRGFRRIHALEPSSNMLELARQKNIYEQDFCYYLDHNPLPMEENTYDCAVMSGGMGEGHIRLAGLYQLVRVIKSGGLVCIVMREEYIAAVAEYREQLETMIKEMETSGKWRLASKTIVPNYYLHKNGLAYKFIVC